MSILNATAYRIIGAIVLIGDLLFFYKFGDAFDRIIDVDATYYIVTTIASVIVALPYFGIAALKDEGPKAAYDYSNSLSAAASKEENKKVRWRCSTCGKMNPSSSSTCSCGALKE